jgi:hypothetical protein
MELHRRHLHGPDHVGELGDAQLVGVQSIAREVDAHGLEPRRRAGRDALLVHLLAADAGGEAVQHARPLPQRVDDPGPDGKVVAGEIQLRRAGGREVHPVGVGDPDRVLTDQELDCGRLRH